MTGFDLSYRGVLASSLGVIVNVQPGRSRANERVEKVTVPGRSGVLHIRQSSIAGQEVFDEITLIPECTLMDPSKADAVCAWLLGSGTLVFGDDPLYCYEATVINAISMSRILEGAEPMSFSPVFSCQPYRYLTTPAANITVTESGMEINNPGTSPSEPSIRINCSGGNVTLLICMGTAIELEGPDTAWGIIIDSKMQDVFNITRTQLRNDWMTGDFPLINPGANTITWTGNITSLVITPNWRWV